MDKDILNHLDKVGQYVQGASEKGFEVYVNGVFVESLIYSVIAFVVIVISAIAIKMIINKMEYEDEVLFWSLGPTIFILMGVLVISFNITGIFAPDYVAIKQIIDGIGGK